MLSFPKHFLHDPEQGSVSMFHSPTAKWRHRECEALFSISSEALQKNSVVFFSGLAQQAVVQSSLAQLENESLALGRLWELLLGYLPALRNVAVACPCSCSPTCTHQLPKDKGSACTTSWQLMHSFSSIPLLWPWGQSGSWSPNHQLNCCYQIIYNVK